MSITVYNMFLTILGGLGALGILFMLLPPSRQWLIRTGFGDIAPYLAGFVALMATMGSLGYSEVWDFEPCLWCWYQRVCMYPLVLIIGAGLWRRDWDNLRWYALPLASIGALFSIYHYAQQVWPDLGGGACTVGVPCSAKYVNELGFVSIPLLALVGFVAIIILLSFRSATNHQSHIDLISTEEKNND